MNYLRRPILITGCARSATSMTAGIFELCGAFGGNTVPGTRNNPKGFFENGQIRDRMVKPYLVAIGADPFCQRNLPEIARVTPDPQWASRFADVMRREGYDGKRPVYYKGAKMALMHPVWHAAFPEAKWVIVRRQDAQIINSCMSTGFMNGRSTPAEWQEWVNVHKARFLEMMLLDMDIREFWPEQIFAGDLSGIRHLIEWAGLEWNEDAVNKFVEPKLWNANKRRN